KVPLLKGDLGGSRLGIKPIFINGFRLKLTPMGSAVSLQLIGRARNGTAASSLVIPAQPELI
ncbi:hypothetical protein QT971_04340, partial [Microcoleus sp. herbarium19]|uniref:hypothetical protein n=1 Tax=Microcoleus sp. herbarium19 TaxID=3055440 RepID=UPI002FD3D5D3